jgi:hypothetical protein
MADNNWLWVVLTASLGACEPVNARIESDPPDTDDTGEPSECGDYPRFARDGDVPLPARVEVCAPAPDAGCPEETGAWSFVSTALGSTPEPDFCGWYVENACGPAEDDGTCCFVVDLSIICEGRPLRVHDEPRLAKVGPDGGWCTVDIRPTGPAQAATAWRNAALAEHASVAAFARIQLLLMALGAPPDLLADTAAAQADEIAHAKALFALAARIDGQAQGPGPLDLTGVCWQVDPAELLVATLREGCWGELLAAAEAEEAARTSRSDIAEVLHTIAKDEARHAALAFRTVRWILLRWPELRPLVGSTVAGLTLPTAAGEEGLEAWGRLPAARRQAVHADVYDRVFGPMVRGWLDPTVADAAHV